MVVKKATFCFSCIKAISTTWYTLASRFFLIVKDYIYARPWHISLFHNESQRLLKQNHTEGELKLLSPLPEQYMRLACTEYAPFSLANTHAAAGLDEFSSNVSIKYES